ncbi:MAG: hypothetical protein NVS2B16_29920 [Chloroflexota bacterium]
MMQRCVRAGMLVVLALTLWAPAAFAHPMGNFSINQYAALTVQGGSLHILYAVDMAEIPTFQELSALNVQDPEHLAPAQRRAYLARESRALLAGLTVHLGGRRLPLRLRADDLIFPPGAAGLPTERLYLALDAHLLPGPATLTYTDTNYAGRAGWKEVVAGAEQGARVRQASVPRASRSAALTVYPSGVTSPPPQVLTAALDVVVPATAPAPPIGRTAAMNLIQKAEAPLYGPGHTWSPLAQQLTRTGVKNPANGSTGASWNSSRNDTLSNLMSQKNLSLNLLLLSLVVAFWFGAGHALSPGHGKTLVAAYLVGSKGTVAQAAFLGLTVTVTHTAGVFALGLVTLYLAQYIVPDQLYPWIGFVSGVLVMTMGLTLFVRRLRGLHSKKTTTLQSGLDALAVQSSLQDGRDDAHALTVLGSHSHNGVDHHHHAHVHAPAHSHADGHVHTHPHGPSHNFTHEHGLHQHDSAHQHGVHPYAHSHEQDVHPHDHSHEHGVHSHIHQYDGAHQHGVHQHNAAYQHDHAHEHGVHAHTHDHAQDTHPMPAHAPAGVLPHVHRHGLFGRPHSHGVPSTGGDDRVTVRSLLALGISGGLLPCPSALVVLLSAIAFHRLALGLLLIVAFSAGLASTLTGIGVLVVYGRQWIGHLRRAGRTASLLPTATTAVRVLPVCSAIVVAVLGAAIAVGSLNPGILPVRI